MKKILLFALLAITTQSLKGQTLEWLRLFDTHSENALGGLSKNTVKDSQNRLITVVVESDILKLYQFDAQGNNIATLNTQMECGGFTPIVKVNDDQFALVYDHTPAAINATYKLLVFNSDLAITQETELLFPESDFFTFGSFFSSEGALYFSGFTSASHFIYHLNSANELVLKHQSAIANAHGDRVKTLPNGNFIFDYADALNHQLRCIAPQTGELIWQKQFVNNHFNSFQLNYRTALGDNQTIYLAGLERTWISGQAHDVIQFRAIDTESGTVLNQSTFALTDGGTEKIDDLKYHPVNQHLYLSYLSNGTVQEEVVLEFDLNFNRMHQARLAYSYDTLSAWVNSKVVVRENGGLAFIYTNYKNLEENGNLHIVNMNADLSINGAMELNVAPKNSSEAFSHALLYENSQLILTGYIPNANPLIGFEEVQFYLAMIDLDRLLNTENPKQSETSLLVTNPVGKLLEINPNIALQNIAFFDAFGKQLSAQTVSKNSFDVSKFSSGLYFIKASAINGKTLTTKFIKN